MIKGMKGLEYTLEILRVFHNNKQKHDSKSISAIIQQYGKIHPSLTYIQKILPRMTKIGLLTSSETGYNLSRPINKITIADVLDVCGMPKTDALLYKFCDKLKKAISSLYVEDFYEFDK